MNTKSSQVLNEDFANLGYLKISQTKFEDFRWNFIHQATKPSANSSADCKAVLPVEKEMILFITPPSNCVTFIQY